MNAPKRPAPDQAESFAELGAAGRTSLAGEFVYFLKTNKKWWLLPILIVLAAMSLVVLLGGSGAVPFIYTLF